MSILVGYTVSGDVEIQSVYAELLDINYTLIELKLFNKTIFQRQYSVRRRRILRNLRVLESRAGQLVHR